MVRLGGMVKVVQLAGTHSGRIRYIGGNDSQNDFLTRIFSFKCYQVFENGF